MVRATSYSACIAAAARGVPQRGVIHSVFRAAANILFAQDFVLSLNAATSPRMPNGLQLSPAAEGWPFSVLRVGMPVLFGAQRLHIEAVHCSLDLTNCSPWDPHIERPAELNMRIVVNNIRCLQRYLSHLYPQAVVQGGGKPPFRYRFFGENAPRPRRGGGGEGKGGDPCGRPSSFHQQGRRATARDVVSPGDRAPHRIPPSPAPTGTKPLPILVCKKPLPERGLPLPHYTPAWRDAYASPEIARAMAQYLCGRGIGLTPSGDDMLAGWMACNWLLHGPTTRLLEACQQILLVARQQTHLLSQCWLSYAAEGNVALPMRDLLAALRQERQEPLLAAAQDVLALGATSGYDFIRGMLLAATSTSID